MEWIDRNWLELDLQNIMLLPASVGAQFRIAISMEYSSGVFSSTDLASLLAIAAGLGWASGIRLYSTLFVVGLAGRLGWVVLPDGLRLLENHWVLGAAGLMFFVEFFADKLPFVDSLWDGLHTFIRIPAGAALAAMALGSQGAEWQLAMAIIGGSLAAGSHLGKAGTRAIVNLSPEPFSNILVSLGEESLVLMGLWLMFAHPLAMLGLLTVFVVALIWLVPRLFRLVFGRREKAVIEQTPR